MAQSLIAITTDFGSADDYVAQLKGVILGINPDVNLVDVTHEIPPQDVSRAALVLDDVVDSFPAGSIHLAVVDPGVGGPRPLVAAEMGAWRFVAPDNGILSAVARRFPPQRTVRIDRDRFWRQPVSPTFHGRDVLAPVAAHWSRGVELRELGTLSTESLQSLPERRAECRPGHVIGETVWADAFGNLTTNIEASLLSAAPLGSSTVEIAGHTIRGIHRYYSECKPGALLALFGSSGRLEISVRDGSAAKTLHVRGGGEPVTVRWTQGPSAQRVEI